MNDRDHYLFVYGTLREDAGHEMFRVLAHNASRMGDASTQGNLYSLGNYPALVPDASTRSLVKGELYRLHPDNIQQTLAELDEYEGLGPNDPPPHEYRRQIVQVTLADGRAFDAWSYVLNRSAEGLLRIDSGDFAQWRQAAR